MARIQPRVLKGFRDYLPELMIARRDMVATISSVFEQYGFSPIDTPALEYSEILLGKYGEDAEKLLYRFHDNGDRDVCMRYDLTVPLARFVAMNRNLPRPFKRYQIGKVWRAENPGRGRFREFSQCDADIIGTSSTIADGELCALGVSILKALDVSAVIKINNRKIFRGLQEFLGVEDDSQMAALLRILDKLGKIGEEGVRRALLNELSFSESLADQTLAFCSISGERESVLEQLKGMFAQSDIGKRGISELQRVLEVARDLGVRDSELEIDLSIARGLDYYTGTVFETFITELPGFGSVMSGGRYDDLIGIYAGEQTPAVGLSVGLDRLLAGLLELGRVRAKTSVSDILIAVFSEDQVRYGLSVVSELRQEGINATFYVDESAKLRKQMKYADAIEVPLVAVIGPDEQAQDSVSLRVMSSGEQNTVARSALLREIRKRVGDRDTTRIEAKTWGWAWEEGRLKQVPNCRGVWILRDETQTPIKAEFAEGDLRDTLLSQLDECRALGGVTFDWYEVGGAMFGKELAEFLKERLIQADSSE